MEMKIIFIFTVLGLRPRAIYCDIPETVAKECPTIPGVYDYKGSCFFVPILRGYKETVTEECRTLSQDTKAHIWSIRLDNKADMEHIYAHFANKLFNIGNYPWYGLTVIGRKILIRFYGRLAYDDDGIQFGKEKYWSYECRIMGKYDQKPLKMYESDCHGYPRYGICQSKLRVCPAGYYLSGSTCTLCPPTSHKPAQGNSVECTGCPGNTQANPARTSCVPKCKPGEYRERSEDATCKHCPKNEYKTGYGDGPCTECKKCSHSKGCKKTTVGVGSKYESDCKDPMCPIGFQLRAHDSDCSPCPQGTSTREPGLSECKPPASKGEILKESIFMCKAGYIRIDKDINKKCKQCDENWHNPDIGNTNECRRCGSNLVTVGEDRTQCVCNKEYEPDGMQCVQCKGKDSYKGLPGNHSCSTCRNYQTLRNKECVCLTGYGLSNDKKCVACARGWYKKNAGNVSCDQCPTNKNETRSTGSTSDNECTNFKCPAGKQLNDQSLCQDCDEGMAKPEVGPGPCRSPEPGLVVRDLQTFVCDRGYEVNGKECSKCGTESFKDRTGNTSCDPCGDHKYAAPNRTSCIEECQPGHYRDADSKKCEKCKENSYKEKYGDGICFGCPGGKPFNKKNGSISASDCTQLPENCRPGMELHIESKTCEKCEGETAKGVNDERCRDPLEGEVVLKDKRGFQCAAGYGYKEGRCEKCSDHHYKEKDGNWGCDPCPPSRPHTKVKGVTTEDKCTNLFCPPGLFVNQHNECERCGSGTGKDTNDSRTCRAPKEGEGVSDDGDRFFCKAEFFRNAKSGVCELCPIGKVKAKTGNDAKCENCTLNEGTGEKQRKTCLCNPGFERIKGKCSKCHAGFYKDKLGDMRCSKCDSAEGTGSTTCDMEKESKLPMILGIVGGVVALGVILGISVVCYKKHASEDADIAIERISSFAMDIVGKVTSLYPINIPSMDEVVSGLMGGPSFAEMDDYSDSDTSYSRSYSYTDTSDTSDPSMTSNSDTSFTATSDMSMTEDTGSTRTRTKRRRNRGSRHTVSSRHGSSRHGSSRHGSSRHGSSRHGSRHTRSSDKTISFSHTNRSSVGDDGDEDYGEDEDDDVDSELTFSPGDHDE